MKIRLIAIACALPLLITLPLKAEQQLRSATQTLSWAQVQQVITRLNLPHGQKNKKGDIANIYVDMNDGTILDKSTGLVWQKTGSSDKLNFESAKQYITQINNQQFAGKSDWRLPTIEELGSIVEFRKNDSRFYIDSIFDGQQGTWSGDISSEKSSRQDGSLQVWFSNFFYGYGINWEGSKQKWNVRAVRSANGSPPPTNGGSGNSGNSQAPLTAIFDNWNKASVTNGPSYLPHFELSEPQTITRIINYHWNNGKGQPAGMISIIDDSGRIYGSWQALGTIGTNNATNVNWEAQPNIELESGTYYITDSHIPSWSTNAGSNYFGFSAVFVGDDSNESNGGSDNGSSGGGDQQPPKKGLDAFKKIAGHGISYHNLNIPGKGQYIYVPVEECAETCLANPACKSFDYLRTQKKCALNDVAKDKAGSSWFQAAEYDYYEKLE